MTPIKKNISLPEALSEAEFGVCMKSADGCVISQNEQSIQYCGDQSGSICEKGCMELYQPTTNKQPHLLMQRIVDNRCFDITLIPGQNHLLTILRPLRDAVSPSSKQQFLLTVDFTPREREVALLMIRGLSNQEICRKLFISRATVKTHINQINKKLETSGCTFSLR